MALETLNNGVTLGEQRTKINAAITELDTLLTGGGNGFLRWCIPGKDPSGLVFKDISGNGLDGTIDASNSGPFAVDNRMSTIAHATAGGITAPLASTVCNLTTDSFIMGAEMTRADPAGSESVMAFGASTANGFPGVYFSHRVSAAGVGRLVANRGNGTLVSATDSTVKFSNAGGTRPTHVLMAYDAPTGSLYLYRDGVVASANVALMTGGNVWTVTSPALGARLGGAAGNSATYAGVWRGWQGYVFAGLGLPSNMARIAALLAESPSVPLRDHEFAF